jgi:hypothetical protein
MPVLGENVIQELGLADGRLEDLLRVTENVIYKLASNQPLSVHEKEDNLACLRVFQGCLGAARRLAGRSPLREQSR